MKSKSIICLDLKKKKKSKLNFSFILWYYKEEVGKAFNKNLYQCFCLIPLVSKEPENSFMLIQCYLKTHFPSNKRLKSLKDLELQSLKYLLCCPGSPTVSQQRYDALHARCYATFLASHKLSVSVPYFMYKTRSSTVIWGAYMNIFRLLFHSEKLHRESYN